VSAIDEIYPKAPSPASTTT